MCYPFFGGAYLCFATSRIYLYNTAGGKGHKSKTCSSLFQDTLGWEPSDRGVSYVFGRDIVDAFLNRNNLSLIVRY